MARPERWGGVKVVSAMVNETSHQAPGRKPGHDVKTCRKCGEAKPIVDFPRHKRTRDGLSSWCRLCHYAATTRTKQTRRERERTRK